MLSCCKVGIWSLKVNMCRNWNIICLCKTKIYSILIVYGFANKCNSLNSKGKIGNEFLLDFVEMKYFWYTHLHILIFFALK
jgi:hypothetical protein